MSHSIFLYNRFFLHSAFRALIGLSVYALALLLPESFLYAAPLNAKPAMSFSTNLEEGAARSKVSGKPLAILFHAVWCPHCRELINVTLTDPDVVRAAGAFEWVFLELDRHVSQAHALGIKTIPQIRFMGREGETEATITGNPGAVELAHRLTEIGNRMGSEEKGTGSPVPLQFESEPATAIFTSPREYRAGGICFSNVGYGPLKISSQSPLQALRLGMEPRTPSTLMKGQKELSARASWVNIWANEDAYFFDYEMLQSAVAFAYGISDTLELDVGLDIRSRFGGAMDGFIQNFHDLFNIDQNGRDTVPRYDFNLDIDPRGDQPGVSLNGGDRGVYSTNLSATLQYNVTCGTPRVPALAMALTLRYEISSDDLEGGAPLDAGFSLALSHRIGEVYLYGTLGYAVFGRDRFRGLELKSTQFSGLFAVEWRAFKTASILLQYLASEGVAEDLGELSKFSHEITLGAKWEIYRGTLLEFGLIENVITYGNSPDFGIHAGLTKRF